MSNSKEDDLLQEEPTGNISQDPSNLILLAAAGDFESFVAIAERSRDIVYKATDDMSRNVLHLCCTKRSEGHMTIARYIIRYFNDKFDFNTKDVDGWSPLHHACFQKNYPVIILLLEAPFLNVNLTNNKRETSLHLLARSGANQEEQVEEILHKLLLKKANLNIQDSNGETALHVAVGTKDDWLVKFLVENGCDANRPNLDGETALEVAQRLGHAHCAKIIKDATSKTFTQKIRQSLRLSWKTRDQLLEDEESMVWHAMSV
eukprot:TRINITY_DN10601_c0_g1_i1.p1 TRINITY_DN10601_c0_g1~~TRINITY_DN10601_c0_g1_i1.p1  ORF type:complete len:261 (+),score=61.36 TRINITY_DN10601_c0_g1_i1:2-784(+)